ncbi:MAG: ECLF2 upstream ORF [Alphaproteobacteria bacterium]|nr:MAG: ECLF2 upstream ORF [Caulobacteraceae bacterium]TPW08623.1 MAG: ECLF2 upstream ORF [Alphaproteobacteria bacterium]
MADRTLDSLFPQDGASDFQIQMASLSDAAQQQARDVVEAAAADGTLGDLDLDSVITNARDASDARESAEDLQVEQAQAAAAGDYEGARELSEKAEYELREVEEKGDDPLEAQEAIRDADYDQMDLETADLHQEIAVGDIAAAADAAEAGDFETAEALTDHAADQIDVADDYGGDVDEVEDAAEADTADAGVDA